MSKCITCGQYYHNDYCWIVKEDMQKTVYQCYFCKLGKDYLTIVDEKTGKETKKYKKEASDEYVKYLKKVSENPKIKDIIQGKKSARIWTP